MSIVAAVKKVIVHPERRVASGEIHGDGLIVPEDLAVAEFEAIDGECKKPLDGGLAASNSSLRQGKISGAVGIESNVDHGLLEDDFVKAELGTEKRNDFQTRHNAVNVGKGNLGGGLAAVDGDSAHVGLEEERNGVDAADLDAAAGDALHFGDEAAADQRLE